MKLIISFTKFLFAVRENGVALGFALPHFQNDTLTIH